MALQAASERVAEARGISKVYRLGTIGVQALTGISLELSRGAFVAVLGPSGSGKSTLLNILGLLDRPSGGSLRLLGRDVSRMAEDAKARLRNRYIGFIFQTFHLVPWYDALRNVELPMTLRGLLPGARRSRARQLLAQVGLSERARHRPSELSGGEQQRVAIARALANNPSLLLADEPTGNLDSETSASIASLLKRINREMSVTVVVVTHNPDLAGYAGMVMHLRDGRVQNVERRGAP